MVNAYTADGLELGDAITRWLSAPDSQGRPGAMARRFGINYIIYDQHIWNVQRDSQGWRPMASRGSDSANHKNHVHVTVLAKGYAPI